MLFNGKFIWNCENGIRKVIISKNIVGKYSYANFEMRSRFFSKFCIPLQFHERLFLCTFLVQTIYTLFKRSSLK